jgi:hypothetical protein
VNRLFTSPVEVDVLARLDFSNLRVGADRSPDLSLELSGRNIIAEERVVCPGQYTCPYFSPCPLTAVEATWPVHGVIAVAERTSDAGAVAPHHLGEVAPRGIVVWVVVRVLGLLLVPTVSSGPGELYPFVVTLGRRVDGREVAAGAFLVSLA